MSCGEIFVVFLRIPLGMEKWTEVTQSCLTLRSHGLQPTRLFHLWNFPGKNTGVGCHFLFQGFFPTQGLNLGLPHCRQSLYRLSHQGSLRDGSLIIIVWTLDDTWGKRKTGFRLAMEGWVLSWGGPFFLWSGEKGCRWCEPMAAFILSNPYLVRLFSSTIL